MSKISRREFLKRLSFIGAIAPFVDIDKLSHNLPDFTTEQLEELSKVEQVKEVPILYSAFDSDLWHVTLKDGTNFTMSKSEMTCQYGNVTNYLKANDDAFMVHDGYDKAWWNG